MIKNNNILISIFILCAANAGTPFEYTLQFVMGYDSNMLRFSKSEFQRANQFPEVMGGADTFDSFVYKFGLSGRKSIWNSGKKELILFGKLNWSDYHHHMHREYGSGGFDIKYRWGAYRNIKYSLRHLDRFYLRHYINRDISNTNLAASIFTDNNQSIAITQKIGRGQWINISIGFLQRYYEKPFTEYNSDIYYFRGKFNKVISNVGVIAFQVDRSSSNNIGFGKTAKSSVLDRSYETIEWYIPFRIKKGVPFFDEIGISARMENRNYAAEDRDDPLHSGRSHIDSKYDLWLKKNIYESLNMHLTARYRTRFTYSEYDWVENLKSFHLLQLWCKIEWGFVYDRY